MTDDEPGQERAHHAAVWWPDRARAVTSSAEMPTHALGSLTVIATAIQEAHGVRADWDKSVKQAEQVLSALEAADLVVRERHE